MIRMCVGFSEIFFSIEDNLCCIDMSKLRLSVFFGSCADQLSLKSVFHWCAL